MRAPIRLWLPYAGACIAILFIAFVSVSLVRQPLAPISLGDYASEFCETQSAAQNDATFQVLSLTSSYAQLFAQTLCDSPLVAQHFGSVKVTWRPRGFLTAQHIIEQDYHLIWNRDYLVHGLVPEFDDFYSAVAETVSYPVFWVGKKERPQLTQTYFANKRVGLLDDSYSQSFFQLPQQTLREAGIVLNDDQRRLYPSLQALYTAFNSGEVDIITSPGLQLWGLDANDAHTLALPHHSPPVTWYLSRPMADSPLLCEVVRALVRIPLFKEEPPSPQGPARSCAR